MAYWWCIVCLAIFLIGLTKSGFGSGAGLMIVPMTTLAMGHLRPGDNHAALGLLLPLLTIGDVFAVGQYRKLFNRQIIARLLPGSVAGIIVGSFLLRWFINQKDLAAALIQTEIGAESVFLVSLHWYRMWRAKGQLPSFRPSLLRSSVVGCFAGVSSTLAHAAGPIIALHLLPQKLDRRAFIGTSAVYFFLVNSSKLPAYYKAGMFSGLSPRAIAQFVPLVFVGALFGRWLVKHINDRLFTTLVYLIAFVLGWYLLFKGGIVLVKRS